MKSGPDDLYGAAYVINGGLGTAFKLVPSNGGWTSTNLHDFTGGTDGGYAWDGVTLDMHGNLYGTTSEGGVYAKVATEVAVSCTRSHRNLLDMWVGNLYGTASQGGTYGYGVV